jgi:hypothetical protein
MKLYRILAVTIVILLTLSGFTACSAADSKAEGFESYPNKSPEVGGSVDLELNDTTVSKDDSEYDRKIIRTATVNAEATNFDESIDAITSLCNSVGGYIESSSVTGKSINSDGSDTKKRANFTIRIPADRFEEFNQEIGSMLNVTSSSSNLDEVTSQYYDIQSRIEVLELQKESLQKMYDNYTNYKDIDTMLRLQDQLYSVIEEIESHKTQLKLYDNKVAYSTVHLYVTEVVKYTEVEEEKDFLTELKDAFFGGWEVSVTLAQTLAIVIAAVTPVLLPIAIVAAIIGIIVLISVKAAIRRKKRKAQKTKADDEGNT